MRILFPYADSALGSFAEPDVEILRREHNVDVFFCTTLWQMIALAMRVPECDLLFCWFGSSRFLPAALLARLLGKRVVIVSGGYDVASEPAIGYGNMRGGAARIAGRLLFRLAHRVFPFSEAGARETVRNAGVPEARCTMIYLGVAAPNSATQGRAKDPIVLTIGYMNGSSIVRKGIATVVSASRLLPEVQFVVGGRADDHTRAALAANAGPNVTFTGPLSVADRDALLARAKVYCQPSLHEGFGMAVAEAMLHECIPVVSRCGSLPEVVGSLGVYVEPNDPEALASAIHNALAEPDVHIGRRREHVLSTFPMSRRASELLRAVAEVGR